jgi:hypothetical protein
MLNAESARSRMAGSTEKLSAKGVNVSLVVLAFSLNGLRDNVVLTVCPADALGVCGAPDRYGRNYGFSNGARNGSRRGGDQTAA